ncbi:2216_t:CDS:2, partial [Racocetra persica]
KYWFPQLNGENDIKVDGRYYQYAYYFAILYKGVKSYKLIWCIADNEPHILGKQVLVQDIKNNFQQARAVIFYNFHHTENRELFKLKKELKK